jgi:hypothetical protein
MSTAIMITSSSEDIDKLQKTISIINFLKAMISNNQTAFIQINGVEREVMPVITSDEINELDSYYSNMYNFLRNPGMTEEEYTSYEQSKD